MDLDIGDFRVEEKYDNRIEVFIKHVVDGHSVELSLSEESSRTMKIFGLLPFVANSLVTGKTLVIDELDEKIHPMLLKYIIMLFNDRTISRNKAQLIFMSYDGSVTIN